MDVAKNKVNDEDRAPIMKYFQKVLRVPTTYLANEAFKELSAKVKDNPQAIKHFENRWFRKSEWGLQYRNEVGIDIDDCETSVRILKDTLLHKSKGFTSPALIDLVCGPIENYHKQRLAGRPGHVPLFTVLPDGVGRRHWRGRHKRIPCLFASRRQARSHGQHGPGRVRL